MTAHVVAVRAELGPLACRASFCMLPSANRATFCPPLLQKFWIDLRLADLEQLRDVLDRHAFGRRRADSG